MTHTRSVLSNPDLVSKISSYLPLNELAKVVEWMIFQKKRKNDSAEEHQRYNKRQRLSLMHFQTKLSIDRREAAKTYMQTGIGSPENSLIEFGLKPMVDWVQAWKAWSVVHCDETKWNEADIDKRVKEIGIPMEKYCIAMGACSDPDKVSLANEAFNQEFTNKFDGDDGHFNCMINTHEKRKNFFKACMNHCPWFFKVVEQFYEDHFLNFEPEVTFSDIPWESIDLDRSKWQIYLHILRQGYTGDPDMGFTAVFLEARRLSRINNALASVLKFTYREFDQSEDRHEKFRSEYYKEMMDFSNIDYCHVNHARVSEIEELWRTIKPTRKESSRFLIKASCLC